MPSLERGSNRIVIAGASSLLGAELRSLLEESRFAGSEFRLVDEEIAAGTLTEAGGEAAVIQPVEEGTFDRAGKVFFTGSAEFTHANLAAARVVQSQNHRFIRRHFRGRRHSELVPQIGCAAVSKISNRCHRLRDSFCGGHRSCFLGARSVQDRSLAAGFDLFSSCFRSWAPGRRRIGESDGPVAILSRNGSARV